MCMGSVGKFRGWETPGRLGAGTRCISLFQDKFRDKEPGTRDTRIRSNLGPISDRISKGMEREWFYPIRYIEFSSMRHQGFRALSRYATECEYCGPDGGKDSAR